MWRYIMPKKTNVHKKEMILASARKRFYEQGYENTYLEHIAGDCGISKQLLIYYFPSKVALAGEVSDSFLYEIKQLVEKRMMDYFGQMNDLQVCTAVEIKLQSMMFLRDEKAMRFYKETSFLDMDPRYINDAYKPYELHDQQYHLNVDHSRDELKMVASVCSMAGNVLLTGYSEHCYNCTEDQLLDYIVELLYRLMHIPQKRIDAINRMSNTIIELLNFKFKPYFVVE